MTLVPSMFDAKARDYDTPEKVVRSQRIAAAIAGAVPLQPAWRALDYGCGTGLVAWELAPRLAHVTLVDESLGMLEVVRERIADAPDRFAALHLDLATQPAPERVDLVYSSLAFHHMPDVPAALAGCRDALRPGGYLAVVDLDHDPGNHFHGPESGFDGHRGFHRDAFADLVRAAGLEEVAVSTATTLSKVVDAAPRDFDLFLCVARRLS